MAETLLAMLNGHVMGRIERDRRGRLSFRYDDDWLAQDTGLPLSFSMKLAPVTYPNRVIANFLWGLLPDNDRVLQAWGQRFQVSPRNVFGLLSHVGEECAGAVQFVRPERIDALRDSALEPLDEAGVAERLRELGRDAALARRNDDHGQLSLAGAQSKTAFQRTPEGWALPSGQAATTHIFKIPRPDLDGQVENEHFCLRLARRAGLPVVHSEIHRFEDQQAIVVTRYDRVSRDGRILRRHQEDLCQALSCHPESKYERHGGPGFAALMQVLAALRKAAHDQRVFMQSMIYNYLIGGTDAHAKNYSILMGLQNKFELAPLYDLTSYFPYAGRRNEVRLAMKIGGKYLLHEIFPRHFVRAAHQCTFQSDTLLAMLQQMAEQLPDLASHTAAECRAAGLEHPVFDRLVDAIRTQCEVARARLALGDAVRSEPDDDGPGP